MFSIHFMLSLSRLRKFAQVLCRSVIVLALFPPVFAQAETVGQEPPVPRPSSPPRLLVSDYGAVADDGKDDREALSAAFEACKELDASVLVFESGTYDIFQPEDEPTDTISFFLEDMRNLTIEGNGATLLARTWHPLFRIHDSPNLHVKNLTVDCDPVPHAAGVVVERGDGWFLLRLDEAYRNMPDATVDLVVGLDPETKITRQIPNQQNYLLAQYYDRKTERVSPDTVRVFLSEKPRTISEYTREIGAPEVGSYVLLRLRARGATAFLFQKCDDLVVEDVTIYSAPGMGIYVQHATNAVLRRVHVVPGPGRVISTCVDSTHFNICRGTIVIEDCVFIGQMDDGSNMHNAYMRLYRKVSERTVELTGGRGYAAFQPDPDPRVGDLLEFSSEDNPYVAGFEARIVSVSSVPTREDGKAKLFTVTLDRDFPDMPVDTLVGNATAVPDLFVMRNTVVKGNRGMAMRVKTRNAIIEDNYFEDTLGPALYLSCEMDKNVNAAEGISNRNILIRNNHIVRAGAMFGENGGAIQVRTGLGKSYPFVHRDIVIEGNTFEDSFGYAVRITSADGVEIFDNKIIFPQNAPIYVDTSRDVYVGENEFVLSEDQAELPDVKLGPGNLLDTIEIVDNERLILNTTL